MNIFLRIKVLETERYNFLLQNLKVFIINIENFVIFLVKHI